MSNFATPSVVISDAVLEQRTMNSAFTYRTPFYSAWVSNPKKSKGESLTKAEATVKMEKAYSGYLQVREILRSLGYVNGEGVHSLVFDFKGNPDRLVNAMPLYLPAHETYLKITQDFKSGLSQTIRQSGYWAWGFHQQKYDPFTVAVTSWNFHSNAMNPLPMNTHPIFKEAYERARISYPQWNETNPQQLLNLEDTARLFEALQEQMREEYETYAGAGTATAPKLTAFLAMIRFLSRASQSNRSELRSRESKTFHAIQAYLVECIEKNADLVTVMLAMDDMAKTQQDIKKRNFVPALTPDELVSYNGLPTKYLADILFVVYKQEVLESAKKESRWY